MAGPQEGVSQDFSVTAVQSQNLELMYGSCSASNFMKLYHKFMLQLPHFLNSM